MFKGGGGFRVLRAFGALGVWGYVRVLRAFWGFGVF